MELFSLQGVGFQYRGAPSPSLQNITFAVQPGEIVLLCGLSGSGKSTLLRQLKPALSPKGERAGTVQFMEKPLGALSAQEAAANIGMLLQDVQAQIVTDTVEAELLFGLENLGLPPQLIRRRVAEVVSYFGLEPLYTKEIDTLSGGEQQQVSLAAILAMHPRLLLLDEPSSQQDPITTVQFYELLTRVNRELGITILLAEQRLEEAFAIANRVLVLHQGALLFQGTPQQTAAFLAKQPSPALRQLLPAPSAFYAAQHPGEAEELPVTVREAAQRIGNVQKKEPDPANIPPTGDVLLRAKTISFRYEKKLPDVLRDCDMQVHQGERLAILGGNGSGKTTLLRVLAGQLKPYRGKVQAAGAHTAYLPQNVRHLFAYDTLLEELLQKSGTHTAQALPQSTRDLLTQAGLAHLLERHPFDLSQGELQKAALIKLQQNNPALFLLDEPTKGLDAAARQALLVQMQAWTQQGKTVVFVTHDLEFAAQAATRCLLLFHGAVAVSQAPQAFFRENLFFTTITERILRAAAVPGE